jgi:hypothetical protein
MVATVPVMGIAEHVVTTNVRSDPSDNCSHVQGVRPQGGRCGRPNTIALVTDAQRNSVDGAAALRLEGHWSEALAVLDGHHHSDALVERLRVLADDNLFGRDRSAAIGDAVEELERLAATSDSAGLRACAAEQRSMLLFVGALDDETPDGAPVLAAFERALELHEAAGDAAGVARSLFHLGLYHQVLAGDSAAAVP